MIAAIYPVAYFFLLLSLLLGLALYLQESGSENHLNLSNTQATEFIIYRDAVQNYAEQNPTFSGSVSTQNLNLPPGITLPNGVGNYITPYGTGNAVVSYYKPAGPIAFSQPQSSYMMDWSYGYVNNGKFYSYLGGQPISIPGTAPQGDIMSFNVQSGNGQ